MPPSADPALAGYNEAKIKRRRLILVIGKTVVLFLYLVFGAYVVILGIAFFLRLFGANPTADFAEWIYRASARIMEPFRGIFPTTELSDTSVFDASLLFAIVMYSIAVIILHGIVDWFAHRISRVDVERERRRYWSTLLDPAHRFAGRDAGGGHHVRAGFDAAAARTPARRVGAASRRVSAQLRTGGVDAARATVPDVRAGVDQRDRSREPADLAGARNRRRLGPRRGSPSPRAGPVRRSEGPPMSRTAVTTVGIIGAGPAGLVLGQPAGRGRDRLRDRGAAEPRPLRAAGAGRPPRGTRPSSCCAATAGRSGSRRRAWRTGAPSCATSAGASGWTTATWSGRAMHVYPQQELVADLIAAFLARGGELHFEVPDATPAGFAGGLGDAAGFAGGSRAAGGPPGAALRRRQPPLPCAGRLRRLLRPQP